MAREHGADYVFTEPSGIVIPFELRNAIAAAGRDVRLHTGPVVLLLNAADAESAFAEHLVHVTRQQVEQSDLVALTKADAAPEGAVEYLEGMVRALTHTAPLHVVSLLSGRGVSALVDTVFAGSIT